jgi:hypothetical protein
VKREQCRRAVQPEKNPNFPSMEFPVYKKDNKLKRCPQFMKL